MAINRKALVVGINAYPSSPLYGSINDAEAFGSLIKRNAVPGPNLNFNVYIHKDVPTKERLLGLIETLFQGDDQVALFYFSGHGFVNPVDTYLVTPDATRLNAGVSMTELMTLANESKAKNRVIILDCCHAGAAGVAPVSGSAGTLLNNGVTILSASRANEKAMEAGGHGIFTNLLLAALNGGAADIRGNITPGSIYAYIDQALGSWEQRPVFKTNITEFISLRTVTPRVTDETLRKIIEHFPSPTTDFPLNPSYEWTNSPLVEHSVIQPYANNDNVAVFRELQQFRNIGLVAPVGATDMYFAAMEGKPCRLTALGHHYWRLADEEKI
jgi:uncharacterized caspase-like protein